MPETSAASDIEQVMDLFLHEIRAPVSVAQGYLRLLLENRLSDTNDRQRALSQSALALERIGDLCASAGEYLNAETTSELSSYPAAELAQALLAKCAEKEVAARLLDAPILGHVRFLAPLDAAVALAALLQAALRSDPSLTQAVHLGVIDTDIVLTTGDEAVRKELIGSADRAPFDQWRGGNGLRVPLALKQLAQTGIRIWALREQSGAVAISIPLEFSA